jgi:coenzyme F420-reducing hydrogenase delta subunit
MAFHIKHKGNSAPIVRRPFVEGKLFNKATDFKLHETRQILDDRLPEGCRYGIVTFEGGDKEARKRMKKTAEFLSRGWTCDGERFRCIYGHVLDEGFMLLVSAKSGVSSLKDLGIHATNDEKGAKRARRFFAAHSFMSKGRVVNGPRTSSLLN